VDCASNPNCEACQKKKYSKCWMVCGTKPDACNKVCTGKQSETECLGCVAKMKKLKVECSTCLKNGGPPAAPVPKKAAKPVVNHITPAGSASKPTVTTSAPALTKELTLKAADKKHLGVLRAKLAKLKKEEVAAVAARDKAKGLTLQEELKAELKMEGAQKKVETQCKVVKKASLEKATKHEVAGKKAEAKQKAIVKADAAKTEEGVKAVNKKKIEVLSKESHKKALVFKKHELKVKILSAKKKKKNPYIDLESYSKKLKQMQKLLVSSKEVDDKKLAAANKESAAKVFVWKTKYTTTVKEMKHAQCTQTKETCYKIQDVSDTRQKYAQKVAKERKEKLETRFSLTTQFHSKQAEQMQFAICTAAHQEIVKLLHAVETSESKIASDAVSTTPIKVSKTYAAAAKKALLSHGVKTPKPTLAVPVPKASKAPKAATTAVKKAVVKAKKKVVMMEATPVKMAQTLKPVKLAQPVLTKEKKQKQLQMMKLMDVEEEKKEEEVMKEAKHKARVAIRLSAGKSASSGQGKKLVDAALRKAHQALP